jgi:transposase
MKLTRVGVDLAKHVFQVHGVDRAERAAWCKRLKRARWIASSSALRWLRDWHGGSRWCASLGARAAGEGFLKLIAPQFVKPYVKTNKTDANDAEAICEAVSRPSMRFVAVKTVEQQDLQAVHRVRSSLIRDRTAKANQLRGLVYEYGLWRPVRSRCGVRPAGSRMRRTG